MRNHRMMLPHQLVIHAMQNNLAKPLDLFAKNDFACRDTTMKLKYILRQIYTDKTPILHRNNLLIVSTS
jgi:hypothetical protein